MPLERRVSILGASGYIGGELLRIVLQHPFFDPVFLGSRSFAGQTVSEVFPHLRSLADDLAFEAPDLEPIIDDCDICFLCLPHGESGSIIPELRRKRNDLTIVDLSADFRLRSPQVYQNVYGKKHPAAEFLDEFIYALPEKYAKRLYHQKSLAAPGCFATAIILMLEPLRAGGFLPKTVVVSAITGSSGSGSVPSQTTHHPEREGDFRAYDPLTHRHLAEIRQEMPGTEVIFVPHSAPMIRGIYATAGIRLKRRMNDERLIALYRDYYAKSRFVRIVNSPPRVKAVATTNYCDIALFTNGLSVVVLAALDNLVKGGAGQAVQATNVALGLPEETGLELVPAHP